VTVDPALLRKRAERLSRRADRAFEATLRHSDPIQDQIAVSRIDEALDAWNRCFEAETAQKEANT
jgi:hypothetical protein